MRVTAVRPSPAFDQYPVLLEADGHRVLLSRMEAALLYIEIGRLLSAGDPEGGVE